MYEGRSTAHLKLSIMYIFAIKKFKVGFPMIAFIDTSLPSPNEKSTVFVGIIVMCYVCNQLS